MELNGKPESPNILKHKNFPLRVLSEILSHIATNFNQQSVASGDASAFTANPNLLRKLYHLPTECVTIKGSRN